MLTGTTVSNSGQPAVINKMHIANPAILTAMVQDGVWYCFLTADTP